MSEHGSHYDRLFQQRKRARRQSEERGWGGEATAVDGVPSDSRKRNMAVPDTEDGKRDGQEEGKPTSPD